ncbi:DNA repair protein RecN [Prevotella sp. SGI.027]
MLKQLHIQNFTLIDELDINFYPGFSVITGETGAGKSIILGAIGLLMGNRADTKLIRTGKEKCLIEAHFDVSKYNLFHFFEENDIDDDAADCIVRREIYSSGKSRAFINDTPVPLATMKELGEQLIDIHSQHQNLLLNQEDFQLQVVDIITQDSKSLAQYQTCYQEYRKAVEQLEELKADIAKSQENEEFLRFQYGELAQAQLVEGEQEAIELELATLEHAEEIKTALYQSEQLLSAESVGVIEALRTITQQLDGIKEVYSPIEEVAQRTESCYIELKDIESEIQNKTENIEFDPQQLAKLQERIDLINALEHKFHVESITELLSQQRLIKKQLEHIDHSDEELQKLQAHVDQLLKDCTKKANQLTTIRQKAAKAIEKEMSSRLVPLGIPNIRFKVEITQKPLGNKGQDGVAFLFSANTNSPLSPISKVASGGEIARVMLSLKAMISGAVKLPTIIFDEIDTGVSGSVAEKMAHIMDEMGRDDRQVISITHLPQIAALGKTHYKVSKSESKDSTVTNMYELNQDQRVQEVAQMLSGSNVTEAALANARELLNMK